LGYQGVTGACSGGSHSNLNCDSGDALTLADAVEKLEAWRRDHNEERSQGVTGNTVPTMLTTQGASPARHPERSRETLPMGGPGLGIGSNDHRAPVVAG
jgi:hypothetical protein